MTLSVKELKGMTVAQLRSVSAVYALPARDRHEMIEALTPKIRRDAKASAYLQRARTYWRIQVVGVFTITFTGAVGGRGLRKETIHETNAQARAAAASAIESKKAAGFRVGYGDNKRKAEEYERGVLPALPKAEKKVRAKKGKKTLLAKPATKTKTSKKVATKKTAANKKTKPAVAAKPTKKPASSAASAPSAKRRKTAAAPIAVSSSADGLGSTLGQVDPECSIAGTVLQANGEVYDCSLNQLNLATNTDKFYTIQVIQTPTDFYTFTHWGRTGSKGQSQNFGPFTTQDEAITIFKDKFKEKTGQEWDNRATFTQITDKYNLLNKTYTARSKAIWQYYMHAPQDGKSIGWYDYDQAASDIVENVYKNFEDNPTLGIRVVQSGQWSYQVDLSQMTQTNVQHHAHTVRQIRRVALQ